MRDVLAKSKSLVAAGLIGATLFTGATFAAIAPAEAGASTGTWRYARPYPYRYRSHAPAAGALVAGAIAGTALGIAAARPYYDYPAYGYAAPVYGDCYWVDRPAYNAWGEPVVRRVQVCD